MLLRRLKRDDVERGQILSLPGAIKARTKGKAQIFVRPAYAVRERLPATDVSGTILVDDGVEVVPGDRAEIAFVLGKPVGVENGMRFAIREGGRTVGAGLVTDVTP